MDKDLCGTCGIHDGSVAKSIQKPIYIYTYIYTYIVERWHTQEGFDRLKLEELWVVALQSPWVALQAGFQQA